MIEVKVSLQLRPFKTLAAHEDPSSSLIAKPRGWLSSVLLVPAGLSYSALPWYAQTWLVARAVLLPILFALPLVCYADQPELLRSAWYAPVMGIAACALPSAGVPVAGGIVFLPMLTLGGVCPRDAVAFSAATQMLGVGVFAPLNWLVLNPSVFIPEAWLYAAWPSCAGLLFSLLLAPLHSDGDLQVIYSLFCLFIAIYTIRGLLGGGLDTAESSAAQSISNLGRWDHFFFGVAGVLGGWLTGYIGVSIEKVLFVLLTWRYGINARTASVTSIALVGWVSALSFFIHATSPCQPGAPGYVGAVPYAYWLMGLPGILIGSVVGPQINQAIGSRNIMIGFVVLLLAEVTRNTLTSLGFLVDEAEEEQLCNPQACAYDDWHY